MLRFLKALVGSLQLVAIVLLADAVLAYLSTFFEVSFVEMIGDAMLIEAALLFLVGGLVDFASSGKGMMIRKVFFGSKEKYSESEHHLAQDRVAVFFLSGGILLSLLVLVAVLSSL